MGLLHGHQTLSVPLLRGRGRLWVYVHSNTWPAKRTYCPSWPTPASKSILSPAQLTTCQYPCPSIWRYLASIFINRCRGVVIDHCDRPMCRRQIRHRSLVSQTCSPRLSRQNTVVAPYSAARLSQVAVGVVRTVPRLDPLQQPCTVQFQPT
jgi:hypothetical protein